MQSSENVFAGLYNTYFDAYNNTTAHNYGYPLWTYTYDSGTNTVHYRFSGLPGGVLPDGNYTADTGRVTDLYGNTMTSYTSPTFFVLAADANHDRTVDTIDFNLLAVNFAQSGRTYSQGDFDYDPAGNVDTIDFN